MIKTKIGPYTISEWPDGAAVWFIHHESGEGMGTMRGTCSDEIQEILDSDEPESERVKRLEEFWKAEF